MPFHQTAASRASAFGQVAQRAPEIFAGIRSLFGGGRRRPKGRKPAPDPRKPSAVSPTRRDQLVSQTPFRHVQGGSLLDFARPTRPVSFAPPVSLTPPVRRPLPRTATARPSAFSAQEKERGRSIKFPQLAFGGGTGDCPSGTVPDPRGFCVSPISPFGAATLGGEAIMGQHGAAMVPGSMIIDRAVCQRGMHLGDDGLCYNKSQISNKERMWPAGRKPLLSGGDMRAISIAARAGRRLEGATKRLQRLGMMKKPASRRQLRTPVHERLTEAHVTR